MRLHSQDPVSFDDIKNEIFDMVKPKDPLCITFQDLTKWFVCQHCYNESVFAILSYSFAVFFSVSQLSHYIECLIWRLSFEFKVYLIVCSCVAVMYAYTSLFHIREAGIISVLES